MAHDSHDVANVRSCRRSPCESGCLRDPSRDVDLQAGRVTPATGWVGWLAGVDVSRGSDGLDGMSHAGDTSGVPAREFFGEVAGFAEALAVVDARLAAISGAGDVVGVPDRRIA